LKAGGRGESGLGVNVCVSFSEERGGEEFGSAEVCEFVSLMRVEENVVWLDVSVTHAEGLVHEAEGLGDLVEHLRDLGLGQVLALQLFK
jgi:hypothetical protein